MSERTYAVCFPLRALVPVVVKRPCYLRHSNLAAVVGAKLLITIGHGGGLLLDCDLHSECSLVSSAASADMQARAAWPPDAQCPKHLQLAERRAQRAFLVSCMGACSSADVSWWPAKARAQREAQQRSAASTPATLRLEWLSLRLVRALPRPKRDTQELQSCPPLSDRGDSCCWHRQWAELMCGAQELSSSSSV